MKGLKKTPIIIGILIIALFATCHKGLTSSIPKDKRLILQGPVVQIKINSAINPGTYEQLKRSIKQSQKMNASLLIIILDTPGGLVTSLRKMVQEIMISPVPICIFVYPPGAQAASAGAILSLSAHIAAMAPGTNIGAAHPVDFSGSLSSNSTIAKKLENDLAALAISIAQKRKRNETYAEEMVRKSISLPATDALKKGIIDLIAKDITELIEKIKEREIILYNGNKVIIKPTNATPLILKENFREKILKLISDPNIAYILMMIGMIGLYFELAHPGIIFPGTVGAVSLLLALYSFHTLSANITGVLLILLAFLLFILELFIVSHGILAVSGAVSLVIGSIILFDQSSGLSLSKEVLWPSLVTLLAFFITIAIIVTRSSLSKPKTGIEGLIGEKGIVKEKLSDSYYIIFLHGELWKAVSKKRLHEGERVKVTSVEGLLLKIKPIKE